MEKVTGTVRTVIYHKESFAILNVEQEQGAKVTVKGDVFPNASKLVGEELEFRGGFVTHGKYGKQFQAEGFNIAGDHTGLYYFLTNIVGHIPKATVRNVIRATGGNFERIIEKEPRALLNFKGIGEKKLKKIVEGWNRYRPIRALSEKLAPLGITLRMIQKIHENYGDEAEKVISKNPYVLTRLDNIGFKKADEIALKMGVDPDSLFRLTEGLRYTIAKVMNYQGHTIFDRDLLFEQMSEEVLLKEEDKVLYSMDRERFDEVLREAKAQEIVVCPTRETVAETKMWKIEEWIYKCLTGANGSLSVSPLLGDPEKVEKEISEIEKQMGLVLSEEQKEGIRYAARGHRVMAIGGYAGCGKTTVSLGVLEMMRRNGAARNVACCALSGVAAKRIESVTGYQSFTIHSLLKLGSESAYDADNPLPHDVIVLDEASMVDSKTFYYLLRAIDFDRTRLILLGDPGQLPPVGPGAPYTTILEKKLVPSVVLKKIYRQSEDRSIVRVASSIRNGEIPEELDNPNRKDLFVYPTDPSGYWSMVKGKSQGEKREIRKKIEAKTVGYILRIADHYVGRIREMLQERRYLELTTYFQVSSPMRKGDVGVDNLNRLLQARLNETYPPSPQIKTKDEKIFREGDRVIHLKNRNMQTVSGDETRVYNGQIGYIVAVDVEEEEITVEYPNEGYSVVYDIDDLEDGILDLGYCLSIHKLQGSEARFFVTAISWAHYMMLNNRLLYTGVTRAKDGLFIVGEISAFEKGCRTKDEIERMTVMSFLAEKAI
jgi:exodeoxyribonuclease V alpha subunit